MMIQQQTHGHLPARGCESRVRWTCLLLALVTLITYWPVRHHEFISFDDHLYVYENAQVKQGLTGPGVLWAFTNAQAINWHPLTWLSHMLDVQLFGVNPGPQHLVSVVFHAANAVLLFLLLLRLTGAMNRSALVAALFALHPLHIESVAWIAERKDVLSTLFLLLTLWAYARHVERPTRLRYGTALACFALGLMSKAMLVTLPFVLLLLDCWPLRRWAGLDFRDRAWQGRLRELIVEKWPFFALSAAFSAVTYLLQQGSAVMPLGRISLTDRVLNTLVSYAAYAVGHVWPVKLSVFYPYPDAWPVWKVCGAALLLLAVSAWVTRRLVSQPGLFVGWCWFLGTLVPVIGLVQVGEQAMADRYTYIPSIGLLVMLVWGMADGVSKKPWARLAWPVVAGVALVACFGATRWNLKFWRDSRSLFERSLQVTTGNYLAYSSLGAYWAGQNQLDLAVRHYVEALRIKPDQVEVHFNLGNALAKQGQSSKAMNAYMEALRLHPGYFDAHLNFGNLLLTQGHAADAIRHFETALRLAPAHAGAHNNLGNALARQGKLREAAGHYEAALRSEPGYVDARINLGTTLAELGNLEEALSQMSRALQWAPREARTHHELGSILAEQGRIPEAVERHRAALRLRPDYPEAHLSLGFALVILGRLDEAITHYNEAIRLNPREAKAYNNLGYARMKQGQTAAASAAYTKALELQPDLAPALNSLASILATASDPNLRDASRAVELAQRACDLTQGRQPIFLQTLAAALAASSRLEEATATARKALSLAEQAGNTRLATELSDQLRRYHR